MENHIYVKAINLKGTLHCGKEANYDKLAGDYFEEKESSEQNIIDKALIHEIKYSPDMLYSSVDGYAGTCWQAIVIDNDYIFYHFRNFEDLVHLYDQKGYKYVSALSSSK